MAAVHPQLQLQTHSLLTKPTTPIEIWRSEIPSLSPPTTLPSQPISTYKSMRSILKKAVSNPSSTKPTPSPNTTTPNTTTPSHHLRPRSLSFHSPISTSSFSLHLHHHQNHAQERTAMYSSSPTSSVTSSHDEEVFIDEDEEALSMGDDEEVDMQVQAKGRRYGAQQRKDSMGSLEKMERLERARRLLESYGGRC